MYTYILDWEDELSACSSVLTRRSLQLQKLESILDYRTSNKTINLLSKPHRIAIWSIRIDNLNWSVKHNSHTIKSETLKVWQNAWAKLHAFNSTSKIYRTSSSRAHPTSSFWFLLMFRFWLLAPFQKITQIGTRICKRDAARESRRRLVSNSFWRFMHSQCMSNANLAENKCKTKAQTAYLTTKPNLSSPLPLAKCVPKKQNICTHQIYIGKYMYMHQLGCLRGARFV